MNAEPTTWCSPIPYRTVLVAGGGQGIGRAVALDLLRRGVDVWVADRRADTLAELTELVGNGLPGVLTVRECELLDYDAAASVLTEMGEGPGLPGGLVHSAGEMQFTEFRDMTPGQFAEVVQSTLFTAFNVVHAWGQRMLEQNRAGSSVILTSALAGKGTPGVAHSCAGKAGIEGVVKTLGREWGPAGLRVNAVGPGAFPIKKSNEMWTDLHERMRSIIPLARFGELAEIVGPIVFMLTEAAQFITGQVLVVDGGMGLPDWVNTPSTIAAGNNNVYEPVARGTSR
jgi:NAD(P)-dependent dehydrogenase (short-subunit alcohol dehydrogenase family)